MTYIYGNYIFLQEESNKTIYPTPVNFPLGKEKVKTLIASNPDIYKISPIKHITRPFEVGAGFFMTQGGKKDYTTSFDYKKYKDLIEGVIYPHSLTNKSQGKVHLINNPARL